LILKIKKQRHKIGEQLTKSPNERLELPSDATVLTGAQHALVLPISNDVKFQCHADAIIITTLLHVCIFIVKTLSAKLSFADGDSRQVAGQTFAYVLQETYQ